MIWSEPRKVFRSGSSEAASSLLLPRLIGHQRAAELLLLGTPLDAATAFNIGLEWEITALITRDQKRRAASAQAASVELDVAWKEWQVAQEARTAAYDVLALQAGLEAAR